MVSWDFITNEDFVSVVVEGDLTQEAFRELTDELLIVCQENDVNKVLMDVMGTAGSFTPDDSLQFAIYAVDVLKDDVKKLAYVYPHELLTYNSQNVARGRGLNVTAFYNFDDALAWIQKN